MMMKYFLIILLIILFGALFGSIFVWQGIYLPKEPGSTETITFLVQKGEGAKEISINLEKQGLIKYGPLFRIYALIQGKAGELKAGGYELSSGMTIPETTEKIVSGDVAKEKITLIEGWNLKDIGKYLEEKGIAKAEEFLEFCEQKNLEGYLFPDTYEVNRGAGIEEIVRKMLDNFDKKLTPDLREEIKQQEKTIFQIVTMASLLEKEVRTFKDRQLVSGVLWKRLENDIPLQVDATIVYITGKKTTKISKTETQIDSPYNTYKYKGLPLGPICNPGLESILAAVYPEDSGFWYYLSTPEGETIFNETLKKHNEAKREYLN